MERNARAHMKDLLTENEVMEAAARTNGELLMTVLKICELEGHAITPPLPAEVDLLRLGALVGGLIVARINKLASPQPEPSVEPTEPQKVSKKRAKRLARKLETSSPDEQPKNGQPKALTAVK